MAWHWSWHRYASVRTYKVSAKSTLGPVSPICRKLGLILLKDTARLFWLAGQPSHCSTLCPRATATLRGHGDFWRFGGGKLEQQWNSIKQETEIERPIDWNVLQDLVAQQMACWHVMKSSFWAHLCEVVFGSFFLWPVAYRIMLGFLILTWRLFDIIAFCGATHSFGGTTWNCLAMVGCSSILWSGLSDRRCLELMQWDATVFSYTIVLRFLCIHIRRFLKPPFFWQNYWQPFFITDWGLGNDKFVQLRIWADVGWQCPCRYLQRTWLQCSTSSCHWALRGIRGPLLLGSDLSKPWTFKS